jgi:hypothetical protein
MAELFDWRGEFAWLMDDIGIESTIAVHNASRARAQREGMMGSDVQSQDLKSRDECFRENSSSTKATP